MDAWAELIWLGTGAVGGACECCNELSGSINVGNILKDSASWSKQLHSSKDLAYPVQNATG